MRTTLRVCRRKRTFADEAAALIVAERAAVILRPYRCALCRRYHLTSRTKAMRLTPTELSRRRDKPAL